MSTAESMTGESKLNFLLSPVVYVIYFCVFMAAMKILFLKHKQYENNDRYYENDEFTRQMAQDMRIAQGRKPNPKDMLTQWVHRGYIAYDEPRGVYVKTGK